MWDFDPDRTADLETGMWQAYYEKRNVRLFRLLVTMLREQYRHTWAKAAVNGFYLARPSARFARMKGNYELVLPDLERAFTITNWSGAGYDPAAVARAELAWWVARRDPPGSAVESVGRLIAEAYGAFYEVPISRAATAGRLRAEAADLRDRGGEFSDWREVSALLHRSHRELREAVRKQTLATTQGRMRRLRGARSVTLG